MIFKKKREVLFLFDILYTPKKFPGNDEIGANSAHVGIRDYFPRNEKKREKKWIFSPACVCVL